MQRRQFVAATGTALAIGLAGCSDDGGADTSSPTAIVESYYNNLSDLDTENMSGDELLDEMDPYLHSESPIRDFLSEDTGDGNESDDRTLDSVDTEVDGEDLSKEEINNRFGLGFMNVSDDVLSSVAEENAVVKTTINYEDAESEEHEHLTATENGDWLIFM